MKTHFLRDSIGHNRIYNNCWKERQIQYVAWFCEDYSDFTETKIEWHWSITKVANNRMPIKHLVPGEEKRAQASHIWLADSKEQDFWYWPVVERSNAKQY